jgi:hypothetical protein
MHDLYMFIRYLVYITQDRKDSWFGLDNWCECENLFINYLNKKLLMSTCREEVYSHQCVRYTLAVR